MADTITDIKLSGPTVPSSLKGVADRALPTDCRQSASTYAGVANATVVVTTSKGTRLELTRPLGRIPIMVRAAKCWLHGLGPKETVAHNEVRIGCSSTLTPSYRTPLNPAATSL